MGVVLAWLTGEGIVIYRSFHDDHRPPMPGQLLATTGIFAACGLITQAPNGAFLGGAIAWGLVAAAFLNLAPQLTGGTTPAKSTSAKKGSAA